MENNDYMIYPLGPPNLHRCCSNCDDLDYYKPVLLRTFKVADSQSIWKICSDHKDDPVFDGLLFGIHKAATLREEIYHKK